MRAARFGASPLDHARALALAHLGVLTLGARPTQDLEMQLTQTRVRRRRLGGGGSGEASVVSVLSGGVLALLALNPSPHALRLELGPQNACLVSGLRGGVGWV